MKKPSCGSSLSSKLSKFCMGSSKLNTAKKTNSKNHSIKNAKPSKFSSTSFI